MELNHSSKIAVVGAGPAGCTAAILLARSGFKVTLIEQHRFPRDKVCGECISALGIEVLERLGLARDVQRLGARRLTRSTIHCVDGRSAEFALPRPMWGISRLAMDQLLLDAARSEGVEILQPARCESISGGAACRIDVRMLESNQVQTLEADAVVVADGKGASISAPVPTGDFGLKAHFADVGANDDVIELFGVNGHYGGIAAIENGLFNIAFAVPGERLKASYVTRASRPCQDPAHGRDARVTVEPLDDLFEKITAENRTLAKRMRRARRVSEWLVSPLPRFGVTGRWPDQVIPIGNAAAALEPVGGEGIGLAMRSAELAVDAINRAARLRSTIDVDTLRHDYRKLWNTRRFAARAGAKIVSSPSISRLAIGLAASTDGPGTLALRLVGK